MPNSGITRIGLLFTQFAMFAIVVISWNTNEKELKRTKKFQTIRTKQKSNSSQQCKKEVWVTYYYLLLYSLLEEVGTLVSLGAKC